MNERNQSKVGYQTSGDEERTKPTGDRQFKGKNMGKKTMKKKLHSKEEKAAHHKKKEKHAKKKMHAKKSLDDRIKEHSKKKSKMYE